MDDGSAQRDVIPNAYDAHNLWGPSSFDTRHILVVNWIYELPFFHNQQSLAGKLLGGWQLSGIMQAQTGYPFTIGGANDTAGVGELANFDANPSNKNIQIWNMNGDPALLKQFSTSRNDPNQWFQTKNADGTPIFTAPGHGHFHHAEQPQPRLRPGLAELEPGSLQDLRHHRAASSPVPGRSVQLHQSPEPAEPGHQPDQRHLRQGDQQAERAQPAD